MNPTKTRIKDILWHSVKALLCSLQLLALHVVTMKSVGNLMSFLYVDLVIRKEAMETEEMQKLLGILRSPAFRSEIAAFSGNDYRDLGKIIMEV